MNRSSGVDGSFPGVDESLSGVGESICNAQNRQTTRLVQLAAAVIAVGAQLIWADVSKVRVRRTLSAISRREAAATLLQTAVFKCNHRKMCNPVDRWYFGPYVWSGESRIRKEISRVWHVRERALCAQLKVGCAQSGILPRSVADCRADSAFEAFNQGLSMDNPDFGIISREFDVIVS